MLAIKNGIIYTIENGVIAGGTVLIDGNKIVAVGQDVDIPAGAQVIDASGKHVTPGIVDAHAHVSIWEEGFGWEGIDVNETTNPVTASVRAIDGINPDEIGLRDAYRNGVTTIWSAPGSANVVGGEGVTMRTYGETVDEMILLSPSGIKAATGENPKGAYGGRNLLPKTRMGVAAVLRETLVKAQNYQRKVEQAKGDPEKMPERDLGLENMVKVLKGELPLRAHCHRADDMMTVIRVAKEFDIKVTIEHATEGHKVAHELAKHRVPIIVGPSLTARSKVEVRDRTLATPGICAEAGVKVALMTDHPIIPVHYLPICAGLAVKYGMDEDEALRAITLTPAEICGVAERIGSLVPGKEADIVIWDDHPFQYTTHVDYTIINGSIVYQRQ
ncbi:MAG: amidohydrolase [Bacillota bacterium]